MHAFALFQDIHGAHSIVAYLPLILLVVAPALLLRAALRPKRRQKFLVLSLIVMLAGTSSLFLVRHAGSIGTVEHAPAADVRDAINQHRALAAETAAFFAIATVLMGMILFLTIRFRLTLFELDAVLPVAFLVLYSIGLVLLLRTFYRGGDLVHQFGL
jgi:hypothetical protein